MINEKVKSTHVEKIFIDVKNYLNEMHHAKISTLDELLDWCDENILSEKKKILKTQYAEYKSSPETYLAKYNQSTQQSMQLQDLIVNNPEDSPWSDILRPDDFKAFFNEKLKRLFDTNDPMKLCIALINIRQHIAGDNMSAWRAALVDKNLDSRTANMTKLMNHIQAAGIEMWQHLYMLLSVQTQFIYDTYSGSTEPRLFQVSDNIFTMLAHTDFKSVPTSSFKVPFDSFIIRFDTPFEIMPGCKVGEAYCSYFENHFKDGHAMRVTFCTEERDTYGNMMSTEIFIPYSGDLLTQIKQKAEPLTWLDETDKAAFDEESFNKSEELLNTFIVNLVLYMNSQKREIRRLKIKSTAPLLGRPTSTKLETYDVGRTISISGGVTTSNGIPSGNRKLLAKWLVRGHWRNQAIGEGRVQHELRWIQPFYKGRFRDLDIPAAKRDYNFKPTKENL